MSRICETMQCHIIYPEITTTVTDINSKVTGMCGLISFLIIDNAYTIIVVIWTDKNDVNLEYLLYFIKKNYIRVLSSEWITYYI